MVLCDHLKEWDGRGGGRGLKREGHVLTYGRFMLMCGKNQHSIVKQLASN